MEGNCSGIGSRFAFLLTRICSLFLSSHFPGTERQRDAPRLRDEEYHEVTARASLSHGRINIFALNISCLDETNEPRFSQDRLDLVGSHSVFSLDLTDNRPNPDNFSDIHT